MGFQEKHPLKKLHGFTSVSSVQSLSCVQLFATPWTGQHARPPLSVTNSQSLLKLMSTESVMPSNHLILCRPLLLSPSVNEGSEDLNTRDQPVFCDSSSMSIIRPENLFVGVTEVVNNIFEILFLIVINTNNRNKRLVQDCKSRPQNSRQQRKSMD